MGEFNPLKIPNISIIVPAHKVNLVARDLVLNKIAPADAEKMAEELENIRTAFKSVASGGLARELSKWSNKIFGLAQEKLEDYAEGFTDLAREKEKEAERAEKAREAMEHFNELAENPLADDDVAMDMSDWLETAIAENVPPSSLIARLLEEEDETTPNGVAWGWKSLIHRAVWEELYGVYEDTEEDNTFLQELTRTAYNLYNLTFPKDVYWLPDKIPDAITATVAGLLWEAMRVYWYEHAGWGIRLKPAWQALSPALRPLEEVARQATAGLVELVYLPVKPEIDLNTQLLIVADRVDGVLSPEGLHRALAYFPESQVHTAIAYFHINSLDSSLHAFISQWDPECWDILRKLAQTEPLASQLVVAIAGEARSASTL